MHTLRWGAMLLLVCTCAALVMGCGDEGRSEEIYECALHCASDGDCLAGQRCVIDEGATSGCCDRFFDRALVDTDDEPFSGVVVNSDIAALNTLGESDVDGSWTRSNELIGFYDGGAAYRNATSPIGDAMVLVVNSRSATDNGDRYLLKVYVKYSAFKPGAAIKLDGTNGAAEYLHNMYNTNAGGSITSLKTSEVLGISYTYGDDVGEVQVDADTASTTVGEEFAVALSVYLTVP